LATKLYEEPLCAALRTFIDTCPVYSPSPGANVATEKFQKKVFIRTFGCQMNEYDSDKMADLLEAAQGYTKTDKAEEADLILLNTCSVRETRSSSARPMSISCLDHKHSIAFRP
jgi:uncharacterized membrane-anchored protein